jgi:hypothetical protein
MIKLIDKFNLLMQGREDLTDIILKAISIFHNG